MAKRGGCNRWRTRRHLKQATTSRTSNHLASQVWRVVNQVSTVGATKHAHQFAAGAAEKQLRGRLLAIRRPFKGPLDVFATTQCQPADKVGHVDVGEGSAVEVIYFRLDTLVPIVDHDTEMATAAMLSNAVHFNVHGYRSQ